MKAAKAPDDMPESLLSGQQQIQITSVVRNLCIRISRMGILAVAGGEVRVITQMCTRLQASALGMA